MKTILLILAMAVSAEAGPYYDLSMHSSSATMKVSGDIKVAGSSSTPNTFPIVLNGGSKLVELNGSSIAFTNGGAISGAPTVAAGSASFTGPVTGISLFEIEDLTANKVFTMANKTLEWQFTNPTGGMKFDFTGAAAGHSIEIMQETGNPSTDMHLLHIHAEDADPTALHLVPGATTSRALMTHANGDTLTNPGRFEMTGAGAMAWGTGAAATDTNLYRLGANVLKTDDSLVAVGSVTAGAGFFGDGSTLSNILVSSDLDTRVAKTGDTMTGSLAFNLPGHGIYLERIGDTLDGGSLGLEYNHSTHLFNIAQNRYDQFVSSGMTTIGGPEFGAKPSLSHRLRVEGGVLATSSVTATGGFYGDVTGNLTGSASLNVLKSGDTMTGPLTLSGSTLTVTGSAFSVGGSTFVVTGGKVGIGTTAPGQTLSAIGKIASGEGTASDADGRVILNWIAATDRAELNSYQNVYKPLDIIASPLTINAAAGGNVGIGTTSPASKLHISSGALTIDGTGSAFSVGGSTFVVTGGATTIQPVVTTNVGKAVFNEVGIGLAGASPSASIAVANDVLPTGRTYYNKIGGQHFTYHGAITDGGGAIQHGANAAAPFNITTNQGKTASPAMTFVSSTTAGTALNFGWYDGSTALAVISKSGSVGIGTTAPASTLQIGTSLNATTNYLQIDTLAADTAGPPATGDCDAATEVGRMVAATRYTATADHALYVCIQTGEATYAWYKTALTAP
jgi:hypothetical protein